MQTERILVTGGAGFIGSNVVYMKEWRPPTNRSGTK